MKPLNFYSQTIPCTCIYVQVTSIDYITISSEKNLDTVKNYKI